MDSKNLEFTFCSSSPRVIFGAGCIQRLPSELRGVDVDKPVIISSPTRQALAESILAVLETSSIIAAGVIDWAVVHVPVPVSDAAVAKARSLSADAVISVGGGSAVGLGKAISLRTGWPHICIPTTYSGSEMTDILGEVMDGKKIAKRSPQVLPAIILYDPDLTLHLPISVSAGSAMNAMAHSIEALYAKDQNPIATLLALESIQAIDTSIGAVVQNPMSTSARSSLLYGALLAGLAINSTGIAPQHKLAHVVAGSFNLPHASTHSILLPHTVAYNIVALPDEFVRRLGLVLLSSPRASRQEIVDRLNSLLRELGIPTALGELGMEPEQIERATDITLEEPYWNPHILEREKIQELLRRAWAGELARVEL